jgi:DNA polymerase
MRTEFTPAIWPEQEAPPEAINCSKCGLCSQRSRVVWGEGNPKAPVIVILDNPGALEDKEGNPYICSTRQTLQKAVFEAGLKMEDLFVTYILKCRPLRSYDKEHARSTCMLYLDYQIQQQAPKLVFCLGNTVVQSYFADANAEVKNLRGKWHDVNGLPTCVLYHPLAVRRRPNLYKYFLNDWIMMATALL